LARPIALVGFMGSGKTTAGRALAERLGYDFADLDVEIETATHNTVAEIFERDGEPAFRKLEGAHLTAVLLPDTVAALGGGTIVDDDNWATVRTRATSVWLDAPVKVLWERVAGIPGRPLANDRAAFEIHHAPRRPRYAEADARVDASRSLPEVIDQLVKLCAG
jgi:shikimate kinase